MKNKSKLQRLEEECKVCLEHSYRSDDGCDGCSIYNQYKEPEKK